MLLVSLKDLAWRRKRVLVALAGTSVVLALTLVLAGVSASFPNEARRSVGAFRATRWVVPAGTPGPFMSSATLPAAAAAIVTSHSGGQAAAPVAILRSTLVRHEKTRDINVLGVVPGTFTDPPVVSGHAPSHAGEATADSRLGVTRGETVRISGRPFTVVGETSGLSYRAGVPSVYVPLGDAQAIAFGAQDLATTIATRGVPADLPAGLVARTNDEARADLLAPIVNARKTINLVLALLWLVAGLVIGSVVYLSVVDRVRELAVFKATGASNRDLVGGVIVQAFVVGEGACALGSLASRFLAPAMPMRAEIAALNYVLITFLAAGVAFVASISAIRRVLSVDPAVAFTGA